MMSVKGLAFRVSVPLVSRFPGAAYVAADGVTWIAWRFMRGLRRRVIRNLLPACDGDVRRARAASLDVFRNIGRYYVDVASLPGRDPATLEDRYLEIDHPERLAALETDRPIVIVSAHAGNPEFAIQALVHRGRPFAALVEQLEPRDYAEALLRTRSSAGGRYYEATVAGLRGGLRELRSGSLLGLIGDRDLQGNGVCVGFLGKRVKLPRGPWEIARREGALVLPILSRRGRGPHARLFVHEAIDVSRGGDEEADICDAVQTWAKLLEKHIRADPGQWTVLEDFWGAHGCVESHRGDSRRSR
jgi:phosphatidylinositol dimannoside acyltransferase